MNDFLKLRLNQRLLNDGSKDLIFSWVGLIMILALMTHGILWTPAFAEGNEKTSEQESSSINKVDSQTTQLKKQRRPKVRLSQQIAPSIIAKFRCTLMLRDLRVRRLREDRTQWDEPQPAPDLLVKLFGPKRKYLFTWPIKRDRYDADFNQAFSWSSCSRHQAMTLVVYDQDQGGKLEVIGELPLRADLVTRMPEEFETKRLSLQLSGGSVRLLRLDFEITAEILKRVRR